MALENVLTASTVNNTFFTTFAIVLALILVAIIAIFLWIKSFNIEVWIRRPVGIGHEGILETGLRGKYVFKTNSKKEKVTEFVILGARKRKLEFHGDAPDEQYKIRILKNGKLKTAVIFQPDNENQLHPVQLKETERGKLEAQISRADIQFVATSFEAMYDKYKDQNFMEKYGMIMIMVLFVLIAIMYWWGSKNYSESAATMATSNVQVANALSTLTNALAKNQTQVITIG
jgi:hypothetical protein